jgi:DNA-binding response OmpR family regulator
VVEHDVHDDVRSGRWAYDLSVPRRRRSLPNPSPRILLVDDEQPIQTLLSFPLQRDGYDVVTVADGREALACFGEQHFDLVVLDLMLPRMDGLEVCRRLRAQTGNGKTVPIIMLTARSEEIDKVMGLEIGADDYITKPFSVREFRSRVKAVLRRAALARTDPSGEAPLEVLDLRIDPAKRTVDVRGTPVPITYVEFEILSALARAPGRVFTRDMLLTRVWGDSAYRDPRTIDVHIRHLREKLELDAKDPEYLFTVRGVGYRFRDVA